MESDSIARFSPCKGWTCYRTVTTALFVIIFCQPILVYLHRFNVRDCDDKAVHYYSAAYTAATSQKRDIVRNALPEWLGKEESLYRKQRVAGRVIGAGNYMALNVTLRVARSLYKAFVPEANPALVLSMTFKLSCLVLLMLVALYASVVSRVCLGSPFPLLLALALISWGTFDVPSIAPAPVHHYHSFVTSSPRGSAALLLLVLMIAYAADRPVIFSVTTILLLLFHAGLAMGVLPVVSMALLLAEWTAFTRKARVQSFLRRAYYPFLPILLSGIALVALRTAFASMPLESGAPVRSGGNDLLGAVAPWLIALFISVVGAIICQRFILPFAAKACGPSVPPEEGPRPASSAPAPGTSREPGARVYVRLLTLHLLFLILLRLFIAVCHADVADSLLVRLTNLHLTGEVAERLTGVKHIVFVSLIVWASWIALAYFRRTRVYRQTFAFRLVRPLAALAFLVVAWNQQQPALTAAVTGQLNFFQPDCVGIAVRDVDAGTLTKLCPKKEPQFFLSLAEYLYDPHP